MEKLQKNVFLSALLSLYNAPGQLIHIKENTTISNQINQKSQTKKTITFTTKNQPYPQTLRPKFPYNTLPTNYPLLLIHRWINAYIIYMCMCVCACKDVRTPNDQRLGISSVSKDYTLSLRYVRVWAHCSVTMWVNSFYLSCEGLCCDGLWLAIVATCCEDSNWIISM